MRKKMNTLIKFGLTLILSCFIGQVTVLADESKNKTNLNDSETKGSFSGAIESAHPEWFKESFLELEEDIAEAAEANKRLVVYFWQEGCPYCNQLWQGVTSDQKIVDEFRKNFDLVAINIWGDREIISVGGDEYTEKTFSKALGIQYTPTLLFFNEDRKVIHRLNGYVPVDNFQKSMRYVSGKHEKNGAFSEFSLDKDKKEKEITNAVLNQQDFFIAPTYDLSVQAKPSIDKRTDKKHTVVFFETENCKNCDLLHQKTLKDEKTLALAKQFSAYQLNRHSTDKVITPKGKSTTAKQWANDLNIEYLPAMIFFDDEGNQVMRIDTQLRTFHIQSMFDYVLSDAYQSEKDFQKYISERADKIIESGEDVDILAY